MDDLASKIAEIETWDRRKCLEAWIKMTGVSPGSRLSSKLLRRALVFELQCKRLGGHSAAIRRQLRAGAETRSALKVRQTPSLAAGTQLVREWNGRIYRVNVSEEGFEMDGQMFSSLSAIAKRITGAQWSGPRFFGLNGQPS